MIYLWIYSTLGLAFIGWLVYWSVKHEGETFYVKDIWKLLLTYIGWPFMGLVWLWLILNDKYDISNRMDKIGDKKLF